MRETDNAEKEALSSYYKRTLKKTSVSAVASNDQVIKPCPFCEAIPVPHGKDVYKIYHGAKCFLAAVYENAGWLRGERKIKQWQQRAL